MKFSLFHLTSFFPHMHTSEAQFYQDILMETDRAEAYGFHSVWFAEHHFHEYGGHLPSVPVLGAAVAQRTKQIRIGSGICLLPLQDPIRVAEEYALLDCLSGGRLEFGIGRGFQKMEYDAFERDMGDSRVLFEEAHDIIMKAWAEERFSYEGKFRKVRDLKVIPKPIQKLPPVYVACIFTEESFEWTGKMGYNLMTVPYASPDPEFLLGCINIFRHARKTHGYTTDPEVLGVYHFYCGETPEKAKDEPREAILRYVQSVVSANTETAYSDQYKMYRALPQAFQGFNYDYLYRESFSVIPTNVLSASSRFSAWASQTSACSLILAGLSMERSWHRSIGSRSMSYPNSVARSQESGARREKNQKPESLLASLATENWELAIPQERRSV